MGKGLEEENSLMKIENSRIDKRTLKRKIQKMKHKKEASNKKSDFGMVDEKKEKEIREKARKMKNIKRNLKRKRMIQNNPEAFQEFHQKFEKESIKTLNEAKMTKGQKKRFKKKVNK